VSPLVSAARKLSVLPCALWRSGEAHGARRTLDGRAPLWEPAPGDEAAAADTTDVNTRPHTTNRSRRPVRVTPTRRLAARSGPTSARPLVVGARP
jgi:hypothetical protein